VKDGRRPTNLREHLRTASPAHLELTLSDLEAALFAVSDEAIPALMGELERLKATLWGRWLQRTYPAPEDQPANDRLLSVPEAAQTLGISRTAVRRLEVAGTLPAVRIGRRLLFRRDVLVRFMEEHERPRGGRG
jgi:excisionase family DNA binding protein